MNSEASTAVVAPVLGGGELLGMGVSMLIVVVAILLLGWFYSRSRWVSGGGNDIINVVATRAMGPKERLLVVEVADQHLLIGMTSTAVQTLHVFDEPVSSVEPGSENLSFAARFRAALSEARK